MVQALSRRLLSLPHPLAMSDSRHSDVMDVIERHGRGRPALMDSLRDIQQRHRHVSPDAISLVAVELGLQRWEVASFNVHFLEADSSLGIHNPNFYKESLDIAEDIVDSLTTLAALQTAVQAE